LGGGREQALSRCGVEDSERFCVMRIVSFGFQTWGYKTLQALIDLDHEVVLAVTHPASEQSYKAIFF
jgi:hypothetical protein